MKLVFGTFVIIYLLNIIKSSNGITRNPRLVCYYFNWGVYRAGSSRYTPQNINPHLCTHLIYAFASFTNDYDLTSSDEYEDIDNGGFEHFAKLKTYNPKLKLLIALGWSNEQSIYFSPLAGDENLRKNFTKNAIRFLRRYKFDGINLMWLYPGYPNSNDKENYVKLVQELRDEFDNDAMLMNNARYLLTLSIPSIVKFVDKGLDIEKLNKFVDWFNILSYDYHTSDEPFVNHHAPLYAVGNDIDLNIDYSVQSYLDAGADSKKIVVGIPTYGRSYTLKDKNKTNFGAPSTGPGAASSTTNDVGYLPYYEICLKLKNDPEWKVVETNATIVGPYAYKGDQWVGYDDENTAKIKANYITNNNLGGAVIWAINFDDFRGLCSNNGKTYQFIETFKAALFSNVQINTTTQVPPTTPNPGADFECLDIGLYPHPTNSSIYYLCEDSGPVQIGIIAKELICPNAMNYDVTTETCKEFINNIEFDSIATTTEWNGILRLSLVTTTTTAAPIEEEDNIENFNSDTIDNNEMIFGNINITNDQLKNVTISTITQVQSTTPNPSADFGCIDIGLYPHPINSSIYYMCEDSGPVQIGIIAQELICPNGMNFNVTTKTCKTIISIIKLDSITTEPKTTLFPTPKNFKNYDGGYLQLATTTTTAAPIEEDDNIENFNSDTINNNEIKFSNINITNEQLKNINIITITQVPPTTTNLGADYECLDTGLYPHLTNSSIYYMCVEDREHNVIIAQELICPNGMNFNVTTKTCKTIINNIEFDSIATTTE